ncbi:glutathione S-transferase family protein [Agaribacterium sp. ZY112]|uniref:glutathione S-transferase family protein n=1 Tax=Agaribacterium sp. ZY112 TaxID=3233574 RepID=UPI003526499D
MLVNGKWTKKWDPYQASDQQGTFIRQVSNFRNWVTKDGTAGPTGKAGFHIEAGRYHLYVALICPWASRCLMARSLLGLKDLISLSVVEPTLTEQGWRFGDFPGATEDHIHNYNFLHELYSHSLNTVNGRATVPVLWDKKNQCIVNNESADILIMMNEVFLDFANGKHSKDRNSKQGSRHDEQEKNSCPDTINLRPKALIKQINDLNLFLYENINNEVYKAGFAQTQIAYEKSLFNLFGSLDKLEKRLSTSQYLLGSHFTESDIRLFVTLIRFDLAYYGLFKCNLKRIEDYPHLYRYIQNIYDIKDVAETVNVAHIKQGYYSISDLNPNSIVPSGPDSDFYKKINQNNIEQCNQGGKL